MANTITINPSAPNAVPEQVAPRRPDGPPKQGVEVTDRAIKRIQVAMAKDGMILDYEETLMRQGFNFINPNSKKSCGCGSSFSA